MLDLKGLLQFAIDSNASDVHISVGTVPRLRIHGRIVPTSFPVMNSSDTLGALLELINPVQRAQFEEKGQIDIASELDGLGRFRVNAYKQKGFISISIRIVHMAIPDAAFLEIPDSLIDIVKNGRGLVAICGVSGAGKSTMAASLIDCVNDSCEKNIITLEDPIEYVHNHKQSLVNQKEVGLDTDSYLTGLRSMAKEDPDIILVDSFKDSQAILECLELSDMGKLVIVLVSTFGTNSFIEKTVSAFPVYDRKKILGLLAENLTAVVSRRLELLDTKELKPFYELCLVDEEIRNSIKADDLSSIKKIINN